MRWSAPPKRVAYMGDKRFETSLSPLHAKSKIRRGLLPTRGMNMDRETYFCMAMEAFANKEVKFINAELDKQVQAGHVAVSPLKAINALHNL